MKEQYIAVYNCVLHGDITHPTTSSGYAPDSIRCPQCKAPIPLVRTEPFRANAAFPGLEIKR